VRFALESISPLPAPPALTAWSHLRRYRARVAVGIAALLVTNALALTVPWLLGRTIEALRGDDPGGEVPTLAMAMIGFAVAQALARIVSRVTLFNAARMAEHDVRADLFAHLMKLEPAWYRANPTGDVMSRLTNDVQTVRALWGPGLLNLVNTSFVFLTALVLMLRIDPVLTLWALVPYPAVFLLGQAFGRRIYRASRAVQDRLGKLSSSVQEDLTGVAVIKNYTLEERREGRFTRMSRDLLDQNMVVTRIRGTMMPLLGGMASIGTVMVVYVGGSAVIDGRITLGQLIQFNAYLALLVWPTLALGWMISLVQRGLASWSRLAHILGAEPGIRGGPIDALPAAEPGVPSGAIEIRDLTIAIGGRTLLDRVSIDLPAGQITAVVGRTGCGKSTLVEALTRLIDVPAGAVHLDGIDVTQLSLDALRGAIGYAPQEAFLFSTTIADNIAMGLDHRPGGPPPPEQRRALVEAAAAAAGLDRDLRALPRGLDTLVGERGITLSGGQRQRVALARALASEPRVLLLDDSLSSVDAETERQILGHLDRLLVGRTAVLISHRVAAVRRASRIVVLDEGRVVETGSHAELLASGGLYADLYHTQLGEESAAEAPPPQPEATP